MEVRLLVVQGKPLGKEIPVKDSPFLVGRSDECHLRPNSELVSRNHCQFTIDGNTLRLRDMGSSNGTIVNGERISDETVINDGDLVQIGPLGFQVIVAYETAPQLASAPEATPAMEAKPAPASPAPVATAAPTPAAAVAAARTDRLGSKEASNDDIHQWLVGDGQRPIPDSGSGIYGGDTQMMNIAAFQDTTADRKPGDTPPNGIESQAPQLGEDEVQLADGRKAKVGSAKQVIEKTREDTSRAASDILRRMMERRPGRRP
jgi:pSer/pThr/pTyr-binding forkhead associated (FHA) protein